MTDEKWVAKTQQCLLRRLCSQFYIADVSYVRESFDLVQCLDESVTVFVRKIFPTASEIMRRKGHESSLYVVIAEHCYLRPLKTGRNVCCMQDAQRAI